MSQRRTAVTQTAERIPRRPPPEFEESDDGMMAAIANREFVDVALNDTNQYGPHAMVMLLGGFATLTGLFLLLLMALYPSISRALVTASSTIRPLWPR